MFLQIYEIKSNLKTEKNTVNDNNQLECLKNEVKSQEELLIGYEKENKKLCKEIASLKVRLFLYTSLTKCFNLREKDSILIYTATSL